MNDPTKPPVILRFPDRPADDLDRLLHNFFRAEMPEPWPAWSPPQAKPERPNVAARLRGPALRRRLVLAASVAVLLVGYLMLARAFPGSSDRSPAQVGAEHIGSRPNVPKAGIRELLPDKGLQHGQPQTVPVPNGGSARMWEQHGPGNRIIIQIEDIPGPHSRR
jgi:hypothetical protein